MTNTNSPQCQSLTIQQLITELHDLHRMNVLLTLLQKCLEIEKVMPLGTGITSYTLMSIIMGKSGFVKHI
jgi:hypothetical protein